MSCADDLRGTVAGVVFWPLVPASQSARHPAAAAAGGPPVFRPDACDHDFTDVRLGAGDPLTYRICQDCGLVVEVRRQPELSADAVPVGARR